MWPHSDAQSGHAVADLRPGRCPRRIRVCIVRFVGDFIMPYATATITKLLETIVEHLDIPRSYYEKAVARHKSLGDWLCRPESKLAVFQPHVSAQGSFRYGTVVRPLLSTD